jgi:hypothetical protein
MWWLAGFAVSVTVALALIEKLHPESGDSE